MPDRESDGDSDMYNDGPRPASEQSSTMTALTGTSESAIRYPISAIKR